MFSASWGDVSKGYLVLLLSINIVFPTPTNNCIDPKLCNISWHQSYKWIISVASNTFAPNISLSIWCVPGTITGARDKVANRMEQKKITTYTWSVQSMLQGVWSTHISLTMFPDQPYLLPKHAHWISTLDNLSSLLSKSLGFYFIVLTKLDWNRWSLLC